MNHAAKPTEIMQESKQRAAEQVLKILRSCGIRAMSEQNAVLLVLDAYVRSFGKRVNLATIALRELRAEFSEQPADVNLYEWLTNISKP
jgi:hypothetical protein